MRILGIDTATSLASVAVVENDDLIGEEIWHNRQRGNGTSLPTEGNRAEIILPLIDTVLEKNRISLNDLSALAVSIGPGSFTGLRIGLATAKGIAYSSELPVIGVSTLVASAARASDFRGVIGALLDARKHEVYMGLFQRGNGMFSRLASDGLYSIESAIELMRKSLRETGEALMMAIGDGAERYKEILISEFKGSIVETAGQEYQSVAAQVAALARSRIFAESVDDVNALVPVYLRRPDAEARKSS